MVGALADVRYYPRPLSQHEVAAVRIEFSGVGCVHIHTVHVCVCVCVCVWAYVRVYVCVCVCV